MNEASEAGDSTQATAGDSTQATAGESTQATAGDSTQATAGDSTQATAGDSTQATAGDSTPANMCSGMCTHFHVSTRKNEEYIKHLQEEQKIHSFERDGVATVVPSPHGNPIESVHVIIMGKVQGVHFLPWAREQAKHMTVNGWIRYVKDGSIEAVFSGKPASVDRMLDRCKTGPGYAQVKEIVADACDPPPGAGFQQLAIYDPTKRPSKEKIRKPKPAKRETSKFKLKKDDMVT